MRLVRIICLVIILGHGIPASSRDTSGSVRGFYRLSEIIKLPSKEVAHFDPTGSGFPSVRITSSRLSSLRHLVGTELEITAFYSKIIDKKAVATRIMVRRLRPKGEGVFWILSNDDVQPSIGGVRLLEQHSPVNDYMIF